MHSSARAQVQRVIKSVGRPAAFVITVKTGAVGITLTAATRVYLFEPALDPAAEVQMAGRIHRLGQTHDVLIKRFLYRQTIEERIDVLHYFIVGCGHLHANIRCDDFVTNDLQPVLD